MQISPSTIEYLAEMVCGGSGSGGGFNWENFPYRSSSFITRFFTTCDLPFIHDGSTRVRWVADVLSKLNKEQAPVPQLPSSALIRVLQELLDPYEFEHRRLDHEAAVRDINKLLARDGLAVECCNGTCHVIHIGSSTTSAQSSGNRRFLSPTQTTRCRQFAEYLEIADEDQFTSGILLPLLRQLGFSRVRVAGHRDKSLEYGKDLWMKFRLPTEHVLYFGAQVKKGRIHSAASQPEGNVASILSQLEMMFRHEVFDAETNSKHLIDHAFLIASGEITKSVRNLLAEHLTRNARRQVLFMDREEILDHCALSNLELPMASEFDEWDELFGISVQKP